MKYVDRNIPYMERFLDRFQPDPISGCWEWTSVKDRDGYGRFYDYRAHRYAAEHLGGMYVKGKVVCHHCDNPGCVNPSHLFVGSQSDNNKDSARKNRSAHGDKNAWAKFTYNEVYLLRKEYNERTRKYGFFTEKAKEYGVQPQTIEFLIKNKHYTKDST